MKHPLHAFLAAAAIAAAGGQAAEANSIAYMIDECSGLARQFHGDREARTNIRDQGQRTDGTHAIGGDIYLETRKAYVACSFAPDMTTLTEFYVDGRNETAFLTPPTGRPAEESAAIAGCRDQIRRVGGPDAQAGLELLSSEFSQAGTMARFRDAGGTVWECIGYSNGAVGDLRVVNAADDGGGAMAGAGSRPDFVSGVQEVRFPAGSTGTELRQALAAGDSTVYTLTARDGQSLYFRLAADGPGMSYQIFNPDGSFLLDMMSSDRPYRGQLWQSGTHRIEVVNRGSGPQTFNVIFGIE